MAAILFRPQCVKVCGVCDLLPEFTQISVYSSPPGQNGRHFAHNIFKCIFKNEKVETLIEISLKFVPKGPLDNNQALL